MRSRLAIFLVLGVSLVFGLLFARQMWLSRNLSREQFTDKKLRVLTYSTFVGAAGPGAEILNRFQKEHKCKIEVVTSDDAGLLLERLKLAQVSVPFDVVIGLDQFMLEAARAKSQWLEVPLERSTWRVEAQVQDDLAFTPFDWSPMAFVYRQGPLSAPKSFDDLLDPRFLDKIALQDPRASSPGLQFYNWVESVKGTGSGEFLARLKPNVQSVSPSWALAYGLFQKEQAQLVFSYVTSLAFHWGVDQDRTFQIAVFPEGHPVQVEYAAVPADCRECDLARALVATLVQPEAQLVIMQKNFMFPILSEIEKGTVFAELPRVQTLSNPARRSRDLSDWDKVFQQ